MKLIFIRHGDPDYVHDSLTEKGKREAALLAERVAKWTVDDFYCSPLGRAQETASYSLKKMNRKAQTLEWLKEFYIPVQDPQTGEKRIPWDFLPDYWTGDEHFYSKDTWFLSDVMKTGDVQSNFNSVAAGIDGILSSYGYERTQNGAGAVYRTHHTKASASGRPAEDGKTLVFFCHLGVSYVMLAHLLGFSPAQLWHTFFTAPTSVTVASAEERSPGIAQFRVQLMGCTRHLQQEPVSASGYFADVFQQ